jgi:hypothetical protein
MAKVIINIAAYVAPEMYNAIQLAAYPTYEVCYKTKSSYQIGNDSFNLESTIYNENNSVAENGWYSDGDTKGYWDGSVLSQLSICSTEITLCSDVSSNGACYDCSETPQEPTPPGPTEPVPTRQYEWSVGGVTEDTIVTLSYVDPSGTTITTSDYYGNMSGPISFCARTNTATSSHGIITDIGPCTEPAPEPAPVEPTPTQPTEPTPTADLYYYEGLYEFEDTANGHGPGTVTYISESGVQKTKTGLYASVCIEILARSIVSTYRAVPCLQ